MNADNEVLTAAQEWFAECVAKGRASREEFERAERNAMRSTNRERAEFLAAVCRTCASMCA